LEKQNEPEIGTCEKRRQRAVDERPVDDDVDVVEAVAKDGDAGRERNGERRGEEDDHGPCALGRQENRQPRKGRERPREREPLELLALHAFRAPEPEHQRGDGGKHTEDEHDPRDDQHGDQPRGKISFVRLNPQRDLAPLWPQRDPDPHDKHGDRNSRRPRHPAPALREQPPVRKEEEEKRREEGQARSPVPLRQPRDLFSARQRVRTGDDGKVGVRVAEEVHRLEETDDEEDPTHRVSSLPGDDEGSDTGEGQRDQRRAVRLSPSAGQATVHAFEDQREEKQ
jgi:hypothetical protein